MQKTKSHKAFSLIELSIVILIIGILVAGITQSSRLVKQFRLRTAQSLTTSSPVSSIKDLVLWLETSLETSFESGVENGSTLATWYDNNPQSSYKNNATASGTAKPAFTTNVFNNGIPSVRFDGSDDFMDFDGSVITKTNYTIFMVVKALNSSDNTFVGSHPASYGTNLALILSYTDSSANFLFDQYSNDLYCVGCFTTKTVLDATIHTARMSTTDGKGYWKNGGTSADASSSDSADKVELISYSNASLARSNNTYYNVDIAEIIMFSRALKTEERQSVESYLSQKYGIKIQ